MEIKILGTESLGVRGLSCVVEIENRKIFIDPGISLGYIRNGLMPHPVQIGVGEIIRNKIVEELEDVTDIVISHFHGDHIPLLDANPYQLSINQVKGIPAECKIWSKKCDMSNTKMKQREQALILGLNKNICEAKGQVDDSLLFSEPVPHGEEGSHFGNVTMTKITDGKTIFVHASDIQFLTDETINRILKYKPDIVFASGPPIYLSDFTEDKLEKAWNNALKLAEGVDTLIIDHHLIRCEEGLGWLSKLSEISGNHVICAADYMKVQRHMLEARRTQLYDDIPVADGWHQLYAENKVNTDEYLKIARRKYKWFSY
ncbi:MAG: MBL fold metallo-hydrolase [Bacillota bacterium]|nr:MBL fold metallo-hydrolase [Bacillota bacterium]